MAETYLKLNGANFLYFADDYNCPYGNKCAEEIYMLVLSNILAVKAKFSVKMIIIACNTATACAVEKLRAFFTDTIIIGTEPAIKPAMQKSKNKSLIVIATALTLQQEKYKHLILFNRGNIISQKMSCLAAKIENSLIYGNILDIDYEIQLIREHLQNNPMIDTLVLGCTHYSYIKDRLRGLGLSIIDGNYGVAARVFDLLKNVKWYSGVGLNKVKIILSSDDKIKKLKYKEIFNDLLLKYNV